MARATPAWALLLAASAAAAANDTAAGNGTAAGSGDPAPAGGGGNAAVRLFNTLLITFGAIFLGLICVRLRLVEPEKGDTKAMGFYTGKIAFPLLIFSTVATANLGDVNLGAVAACNLGKVVVMIFTAALAFFAYKPGRDAGQQVLTATVFAFFAVASNDFAIGFPVIDAIYGQSMVVYIAANALVGSFFFVPLTIVLFSIGGALQKRGSAGGGGGGAGAAVLATLKDVMLNPVITCTVAGLLYKVALPFTLTRDGDKLVLPDLLSKFIKLFTGPFVMSALFLTGTTLRSARLAIWPVTLVIMKVVVCAFVSFLFGQLLVGDAGGLRDKLLNFTYFYGSIPTSSAPLVFASQFDPGATELISTSILLGLILAGPIMFVTTLFLSSEDASTGTLSLTQLSTIGASLVCGACLLALLSILRREWGWACPCKKLVALYAVVLLSYEALAFFFNPVVDGLLCENYSMDPWSPSSLVLSWLQNSVRIIMMVLQFALVMGPKESPDAPGMGTMMSAACLGLSLIVAFLAGPNTIDQICHRDLQMGQDFRLVCGFVWTCLLLAASLGLAAYGICRKRREKRGKGGAAAAEASSSDSDESSREVNAESASDSCEDVLPRPSERSGAPASEQCNSEGMCSNWVRQVPKDVIKPMSVIFALTLLVQVVNTVTAIMAEVQGGSFMVMLILESLLVHGQLVYLSAAIFLSDNLTAHAASAVPRLCSCCRRREAAGAQREGGEAALGEIAATSGVFGPDAMLGSFQIPTALPAEALEDGAEEDGHESP